MQKDDKLKVSLENSQSGALCLKYLDYYIGGSERFWCDVRTDGCTSGKT